jgi:hypothetical protein
VAAYRPVAGGRLEPEYPRRCPWVDSDKRRCKISEHHTRARGTGPQHPLVVAECKTHGHSFTIYPPGYAPYLRRPVLDVVPDGTSGGAAGAAASLFEAARDAAAGRSWRPSGAGRTTGRWRTQQRHVELAVKLFGLDAKAPDARREQISHHLAVPLLDLVPAPPQKAGLQSRGRRVMELFARLPRTTGLPKQLLRCGVAAGLWPEPVFV